MNYHINTTLIWDNFKRHSECPICDIYKEVELRIIEQFQGEAVMIDEFRQKVNTMGFCKKHFTMIMQGEHKLGTALQAATRLNYLQKHLPKISKIKQAEKAADEIIKSSCTCVVCEMIEGHMQRYYRSIVELYYKDEQFQRLLNAGKGFCLPHYAHLIKNAKYAKSDAEQFLIKLQEVEERSLSRLAAELDTFAARFDYRNKDKPVGNERDILPRTINKICN